MSNSVKGQGPCPKINLLGNAQKSGVNLSRVINQASTVRTQHQFSNKNKIDPAMKAFLNDQALKELHQNYSAIHDFAQDQLSAITSKEYKDEQRKEWAAQKRPASRDFHQTISESVLSYITAKDSVRTGMTKSSIGQGRNMVTRASTQDGNRHHRLHKAGVNAPGRSETPSSDICTESDCHRQKFKERYCKHHFAQRIKKAFRFHFKNMYRGPEQAFGNMDFHGKGYILESDILQTPIMHRIRYSRDDVQLCFKMLNLFNNVSVVSAVKDGVPPNGMSFDKFREIFFPQLHILEEEAQSDEDRNAKEMERQYTKQKKKQSEILSDRIKALDEKIQQKIAANFQKVREAFLALDDNFDGFVTVQDFMKHFGTDRTVEYDDLMKLLKIKDRNGEGKIDFGDFSKWFGSVIHNMQGFYFRHDSKTVNPEFNRNMKRFKMKYPEKDLRDCREAYNDNLIQKILAKIYFQWKTMRSAFMALDVSRSGSILRDDLEYYLTHWGVQANEEKFNQLFNYFDHDGDGKVSYKDFQLTAGREMQPDQGKYWRQDMPRPTRIKSCKNDHCWLVAQDFSVYCKVHLKMVQSKAFILIQDIKTRLRTRWEDFIAMLRMKADPEDQEQVFNDDFKLALDYFRIKLTESQLETLQDAFPGRKEGNRKRIRVGRFYDINVAIQRASTYKNMKVKEQVETVQDASGYTGQMYQKKPMRDPIPLTEAELVSIFLKNNKMKEFIRICREINEDKNGVVTVVELDDILRLLYEEELEGRDLSTLYEPFIHVHNKILINYKLFRDDLVKKINQVEQHFGNTATSNFHTSQNQTPNGAAGKSIQIDQDPQSSIKKDRQNYASLGVVAIKELLEKEKDRQLRQQQQQQMRLSHTDMRSLDKKRNSNFKDIRNQQWHALTLEDDFSPYNDYAPARTSIIQPIPEVVGKARPSSSLNKNRRSSHVLKSNHLINQGLLQDQAAPSEISQSTLSRRGKSAANLQSVADIQNYATFEKKQPSGQSRRASNLGATLNYEDGRYITAEGRQTPLHLIQENPHSAARNSKLNQSHGGKHTRNGASTAYHTNQPSIASTARGDEANKIKKENIKAKVAYEWKSIFRYLTKFDSDETGTCSKAQFQLACKKSGVNVPNDDIRQIGVLFAATKDLPNREINYVRMSKELNLHYGCLSYLANKQSKLEHVKEVMSKSGKSDYMNLSNYGELRDKIRQYQGQLRDRSPSGALSVVNSESIHSNYRRYKKPAGRATSMSIQDETRRMSSTASNLNRQIFEEAERRKNIQNILKQRQSEFLSLADQYLKAKGASTDKNGTLLQVSDFKQILQAFGLELTPQELKQLVVKTRLSSTGQNSLKLGRGNKTSLSLKRTPNTQALRMRPIDDNAKSQQVKIVNGYPQMTPSGAIATESEASAEPFSASFSGYKYASRNQATRSASVNSRVAGAKASASPFIQTDSYARNKTRNNASHALTLTSQLEAMPGINMNDFLKLYA